MKIPIDWLLQGPAWIRCRTRIDLLVEIESSPAVVSDRKEIVRDKQIAGLIDDLSHGPWAAAPELGKLWATRKNHRPYLFGIGTDFPQLKAPLIWYDLLHELNMLSHYGPARQEPRFLQMIRLLESKADRAGLDRSRSLT